MADNKIMDPAGDLDYRLGGETWDSWALKYMQTIPYIFRALNALNGTDDTGLILPLPSGAGALVRKNANGTVTVNIVGNASTADKLTTARTISLTGNASGSAAFDGSGDVSINVSGVSGNATAIASKDVDTTDIDDGTILVYRSNEDKFVLESKGTVGAGSTLTITNGTDVLGTFSGDVAVTVDIGTAIQAAMSGQNAPTATKLQTARSINGTAFDGSANITTTRWGTARNITIKDADATNSGTATSVDGSAAAVLKLPATIKANLTGNVTGTATQATKISGKTIPVVSSFDSSTGTLALTSLS